MRPRSPAAGLPGRDRIQRRLAYCALLALVVAMVARGGFAAEQGKTITLGESLNTEQQQELLSYFKATADDRVLTSFPLFYIAGNFWCMLAALVHGRH